MTSCRCASGLSPLARGTRVTEVLRAVVLRFIPAGAGNTNTARATRGSAMVYPRWRGEHTRAGRVKACPDGLSPLARGTQSDLAESQQNRRFIPAGAGNTRDRTHKGHDRPVYPRWRGEHIASSSSSLSGGGLSPLARGTHESNCKEGVVHRFIPAGAGNTFQASGRKHHFSVYPRWRGEHSKSRDLFYNTFFGIKNSTDFSMLLKIANLLIFNR